VLAYYPDLFSPLSVKIDSRGVPGAALLSEMYAATEASLRDVMEGGLEVQSELQAATLLRAIWWDLRPV